MDKCESCDMCGCGVTSIRSFVRGFVSCSDSFLESKIFCGEGQWQFNSSHGKFHEKVVLKLFGNFHHHQKQKHSQQSLCV